MTISRGAQGTSAQPPRRASRPTRRVLALVVLLTVVGTALWLGVQASPPDPPADLRIPWWVLALMFAATEIWVFHIQVGREAQSISISEIPFMLAFFYSVPEDLLIARVVGPALVMLLHRRQTLLKSGVNIALIFADTAVALVVFRVVGGGSTARRRPRVDGRGARLRRRDGRRPGRAQRDHPVVRREAARSRGSGASISGLGLAAASAMIGLMPLLTLRLGILAAVPLVASGVMLMAGYRAYASLADRHSSLERLFRFSRELNVAPESDDVLPSVLEQARELLRGESAEVLRFGDSEVTVWRLHGSQVGTLDAESSRAAGEATRSLIRNVDATLVRGDDPAGRHYLQLRGADEAVLAPLRYDGLTVGAIAVHDRLGEVRGFSASDVQLLQTIANHASVALHNEMLIGRLRHDALHDTLTGLPNRAQLTTHANVALADARTGGGEVALMIIDLNGFKVVNDTLGHHVGDDLLRQVAQRFADAAPWGVTVARLGGDEFAVLVPPAVPVQADKVAHLLLEPSTRPFTVGEERLHLSGSAGIALAPGPRAQRLRPAQARRHRDVRREERPRRLRALPRRHRRERPVAAVADGRAARGHRGGRGRHRGRAASWTSCDRPDRVDRGARPLAPPGARHAAAGAVPAARGAQRAHRPADRRSCSTGPSPRARPGARPGSTSASR